MDWINYRQLNDKEVVSSLYTDYIQNFSKVERYYAGNYSKKECWLQTIHNLQKRNYDRNILQRVLNEQNREFQAGIKTLSNIDLLGNDNTFAVVTGQQLGLFTGPLYTVYKAITAVKLAAKLTNDFPDYNFVPIFWLEGEDHDFEEVNKIKVLNTANENVQVQYLVNGKQLEKNIGATGAIILDDSINGTIAELESFFPQTDFSPNLFATLRGYYKSGSTFLKSFSMFFNHFFEDSGLVFLNANVPELKKPLSVLFQNEIQSNSKTSTLVIKKSAELEENYHAQIKAKAINLFMFFKGGRFLIEPSDSGDYYLKNTRQRFTLDELLNIAKETPHLLSPNVVTRPLCQDTLLPTIAYVAGPAEVAYFGQLKSVYEYCNITMPIIYPRASITLVEEKVNKILEKYSLRLSDLFGEIDSVLLRVSEQVSEVKVDELFLTMEKRIVDAVNEVRFGVQQIDPTLNGTIDGTIQKFVQQLDVLKQKTQRAQLQKEEISLKQIRKASMNIFPNGNFQEREFSIVQYLNKYGPDFVKWISNEIVIDKFQHQVISI